MKSPPLQRKTAISGPGGRSAPSAPPIVHEVLRSPGQPLDSATRAFMEPRFGRSFGQVRLHTDAKASESARAVNALAYTVGHDIVFDHGRYQPRAAGGSFLLAHELVHTLQQDRPAAGAPGQAPDLQIGDPGHRSETEADTLAHRALAPVPGGGAATRMAGPPQVQTKLVVARIDCSTLTFKTCKSGIYSCGYGGSGTCGWGGKCVCMGADKPSPVKVLAVLKVLGISVLLIGTILLALLDPEPATKLGLAGLSVVQVALLLHMLGYKNSDDPGTTSSAAASGSGAAARSDLAASSGLADLAKAAAAAAAAGAAAGATAGGAAAAGAASLKDSGS